MRRGTSLTQSAAEQLAIQALTYLAGDEERLGRFLAVTGLGPDQIRAAAGESGFLAGVLDYLCHDETLLTGFASEAGIDPGDIGKALRVLGAGDWERDSA